MAVTLTEVQALLEDDAASHGFGNKQILELIAAGRSANRIAALYYRKRAAQTLYLVNVSEAGSSRSLDSIYPRMVGLAQEYEKLAVAEETPIDPTDPESGRYMKTYPITRV